MINYKYINKSPDVQINLKAISELGKENWNYINELDGILIFSKKVAGKTDRTKKEAIKTPERKEFHALYKEIKNSGLSNDSLIHKYNKLVEEGKHNLIMDNLREYKIYLDVKKKKEYALMASTYINQARYNDKWEVVQDMSRKWVNDIYKERGLTSDEIDLIEGEVSKWESTQHKEIRSGVLNNMITQLLNK